MTISAGFTDDDKCVRDEMLIVMTVKGEMTEEQKKQMKHDSVHGFCIKDIQNPQFQTPQGHIPKTMNCIRETLQYTTMKKYTVNTSYKKVRRKNIHVTHIYTFLLIIKLIMKSIMKLFQNLIIRKKHKYFKITQLIHYLLEIS